MYSHSKKMVIMKGVEYINLFDYGINFTMYTYIYQNITLYTLIIYF